MRISDNETDNDPIVKVALKRYVVNLFFVYLVEWRIEKQGMGESKFQI